MKIVIAVYCFKGTDSEELPQNGSDHLSGGGEQIYRVGHNSRK